jgi:glucosyl-dolichyl phosphate glucuronosyltransferase
MQSLITLTFDDGLRSQFEQALPILNQHRLPATFFLVANTDPILIDGFKHPDWNKTDWNEQDIRLFKTMDRQGHEIGAHSVHHRQPFLDSDPKLEAEGSKKWIEDRVGVEISSYCYPLSHYTDPIMTAVVDAGFKQARWGANAVYYPLHDPIDNFKVDSRHISKCGFQMVDGNYVGKYGAENVAGWLRPGCWHVLMFHGIGTVNDGWWSIPVAEFARQMAELAKFRDSGDVEVVTFKEGAQRLSRAWRSGMKRDAPEAKDSMSITVVLCTYNRSQDLAKALDSIAVQTFPEPVEWEILVVDNNSTDQTPAVVEEYSRKYPSRVRYITEQHQGLSHARNAGIRNAKGDILVFTDDDSVEDPGWLCNLTSKLHSGEWAGAGGRIIPAWAKAIPNWLSTDDPHTMGPFAAFDHGTEAGPLTVSPYGGNMAFRREVFEKYGGFRVDLGRAGSNLQGREDVEFANRLLARGERLRYEPGAVVRHPVLASRMEENYVLRWWYWYGRSEITESGPPPDARLFIFGVPLKSFRRLLRWTLQRLITLNPARRFACRRNVWYIAGTMVGCFNWARRPHVAADGARGITGTHP